MDKLVSIFFAGLFFTFSNVSYCTVCPDPQSTSLKWGIPPSPWQVNPLSSKPQAGEDTHFTRANILLAGYGQGVVCSYKNALGSYSIWWQVLTKIPARSDYTWIDTLGGFVCTQGLSECNFYVADIS